MAVIKERVLASLTHPVVNRSYIAERLYGSRITKNRTKLSEKISGRKGWKDWELERLEEIFSKLKKEL
jgi:hypothetical protein